MASQPTPISRDLWMPDASTRACIGCERLFTAIRRRHHCRFCGLIYCSACSSQRVPLAKGQKPVRICNPCAQTLARSALSRSTSMIQPESNPLPLNIGLDTPSLRSDSVSSFASSFSSVSDLQVADQSSENTLDSIMHDLAGVHCDFDEACAGFLESHTKELLQSLGLSARWNRPVVELVKCVLYRQVVHALHVSARLRSDSMNATRYLKIVKVPGADPLCRFVDGLAFYRSLPNKKMKARIENPNILMLEDAAGLTSSDGRLLSMEMVLQQEENYSQIFVKKALLLKPSLILVERSMSERTLSELASHGVTALINVKKPVMELVSRLCRAKILHTIDQAASHRKSVLGSCKDFSTRAVGQKTLVLLTPSEDVCHVGSVLLSGNGEDLKALRNAVRKLVVEYRGCLLEAELMLALGCECRAETMNDHHAASATFLYLMMNSKPCLVPQPISVQFYLDGDSPLGLKLVRFAKQANEPCVCGVPSSEHRDIFLGHGGAIRISKQFLTSERVDVNEKDVIYVKTVCNICGRSIGSSTLPPAAWEYSFYKFMNNFFLPFERPHKVHQCGDFFRDYTFIFTLQNVQLKLSYLARQVYELRSPRVRERHSDRVEELYSTLKFKALLDLKSAAQEVAGSLLHGVAKLLKEIDAHASEEANRHLKDSFESLKAEVKSSGEAMSTAMEAIAALSDSDVASYLSVESYRRTLFFAVCRVKTLLENTRNSLAGKTHTSRHSSPENSMICNPGHSYSSSLGSPEMSEHAPDLSFNSTSRFLHPRSPSKQLDPLLRSRNFEYLQRGALTLPLGADDVCVPVDEENPLSVVAYTINSASYRAEVGECREETVQAELLSAEPNHHNSFFSTYEDSDLSQAENRTELQKFYGPSLTFHVTAYYPRQFQALQTCYCSHANFILSLARSSQSRNGHILTHDERFLGKLVDEKEFAMFLNLAPNYFRYMFKTMFRSMPSVLVRVLGAFRVSVRKAGQKRIDWVLIMENLLFEVPRPSVFDISVEMEEGKEKGDRSFLEAVGGAPLCLTQQGRKVLNAAVWNDSRFLSKQNFTCYSLQLLMGEAEVWAGISNYGLQFTFDKAVSPAPSKFSLKPAEYKEKFRAQIVDEFFAALEQVSQ